MEDEELSIEEDDNDCHVDADDDSIPLFPPLMIQQGPPRIAILQPRFLWPILISPVILTLEHYW